MNETVFKKLFGKKNVVAQHRQLFYATFPFDSYMDGVRILSDLSYQEDSTFVYYNGEVLSTSDFLNMYGGK